MLLRLASRGEEEREGRRRRRRQIDMNAARKIWNANRMDHHRCMASIFSSLLGVHV
jgi:hypothetical protein